jgi:hypothetical protein
MLRGMLRGLLRGMLRGMLRGLLRGLLRGMLRGLLRGMLRGLLRGMLRGLLRGMLRGLLRGMLRGLLNEKNLKPSSIKPWILKMFYLLSDRGFYAGEGEDRPRWMQGFKFSVGIDTYEKAFKIGMLTKSMRHITYFEILKDTDTERREFGR